MKAVVNVTKIDWDTDTDDGDTTGVDSFPEVPFTILVYVDSKDEVLDLLLETLSDVHGYLIRDVQYTILSYGAEMDESSHYS